MLKGKILSHEHGEILCLFCKHEGGNLMLHICKTGIFQSSRVQADVTKRCCTTPKGKLSHFSRSGLEQRLGGGGAAFLSESVLENRKIVRFIFLFLQIILPKKGKVLSVLHNWFEGANRCCKLIANQDLCLEVMGGGNAIWFSSPSCRTAGDVVC